MEYERFDHGHRLFKLFFFVSIPSTAEFYRRTRKASAIVGQG